MNKNDIILCAIILVISLFILGIFKIKDNKNKEAIVYHNNDVILKIDLTDRESRTYTVNGDNGDVVIETVDGKVKVVEEISPKHLCSIQGYIENSMESIICLPNRIVIKINEKDDIDTVVK